MYSTEMHELQHHLNMIYPAPIDENDVDFLMRLDSFLYLNIAKEKIKEVLHKEWLALFKRIEQYEKSIVGDYHGSIFCIMIGNYEHRIITAAHSTMGPSSELEGLHLTTGFVPIKKTLNLSDLRLLIKDQHDKMYK